MTSEGICAAIHPAAAVPVPTQWAGKEVGPSRSQATWHSVLKKSGTCYWGTWEICSISAAKRGSDVPQWSMPELFHVTVPTVILIVSYKPWHLAVPPRTACATEIRRSEWISAPFLLNTELFWTWKAGSCKKSWAEQYKVIAVNCLERSQQRTPESCSQTLHRLQTTWLTSLG